MYLIFLLGGDRGGGKGVYGRLMSPAHETQSMREIRLLRGRLPRKGGGLTGMNNLHQIHSKPKDLKDFKIFGSRKAKVSYRIAKVSYRIAKVSYRIAKIS